ncbi:MAG: hypothetical protein AAF604_22435 [Acidobacteriota bacterium]
MRVRLAPNIVVHPLTAEERVILDARESYFYGTYGLASRILDHLQEHQDSTAAGHAFDGEAPRQAAALTEALLTAGILEPVAPPAARPRSATAVVDESQITDFVASGEAERRACLLRHGSVRSLTLGPSAGVGESGNPLIFRSP